MTLNSAHLPSSPSIKGLVEEPKAVEHVTNDTHTDSSVKTHTPPSRPTPVCHEKPREDSNSLKDLLQGAKNIAYEARDDSTGISFVRNSKREWVPDVVPSGARK